MANPALDERFFKRGLPEDQREGWAMPRHVPPAPDTVSPWPPVAAPPETMSVGGTTSATAVLLVLLVAGAGVGWFATDVEIDRFGNATGDIPGMLLPTVLIALGIAILTVFKPLWAIVTGPLYAVIEGFALGVISHVYEVQWDGIVLQALGLTIAAFTLMLVLFATGRLRLGDRGIRLVAAGTMAIAVVYGLSLLVRVFGGDVPFIHDSGPIGILFSLFVVGLAIANLLVDFEFIERAVAARAPKRMEWYAAFGLLVTIVWLYLELLRLLAKLRER